MMCQFTSLLTEHFDLIVTIWFKFGTRLRKRLVDNNKKLKTLLGKYNAVLKEEGSLQTKLLLADVQNGKFPWETDIQDKR